MKSLINFICERNLEFQLLDTENIIKTNKKFLKPRNILHIKILNYNQNLIDKYDNGFDLILISEEKNVIDNLENLLELIEDQEVLYYIDIIGYSKKLYLDKYITYQKFSEYPAIISFC